MSTRLAFTYIQRGMVTQSWTSTTVVFSKKNDKMTGNSIFLPAAGRRKVR